MTWRDARSSPPSAPPATAPTAPADDPNLRALVAAETPVVTIFGKSWLLHVTEVLGATPDENLAMIARLGRLPDERGREVVYDAEHFFDGYKADPDYALATLRAARQAGARTLVLCDTNGGTHDRRAAGDRHATSATSLEADPARPTSRWGIHTHNDAELAVANSLAAVAGRRPPRPGDDQRLRRALRQRQHGQHPGRTSR